MAGVKETFYDTNFCGVTVGEALLVSAYMPNCELGAERFEEV